MNLSARVLLGPALYFYACAAMSPDRQLSRRAILFALSGPVLVVVAMLPFIFGLSSQEKLALADPATRNPEHWKIAIFICSTAMLIFMLFTSAYLLAALRLHQQHRRQLMERFSAIEQRSLDWFRPVLILWGFAWLFFGLEYILNFMGWRWFGSGVVLPLLEILILVAFTQKALQQPALDDSEKVSHKPEPARVAALKSEQMQQVADKLDKVMKDEKLFLGEDLSLNRISGAISVSENHISETLSKHLKTNFFKYVHGHRIEAAKALLISSDKLVSTIGFEVGFNTKSTFNAAFKKSTELTPTAFRQQQL